MYRIGQKINNPVLINEEGGEKLACYPFEVVSARVPRSWRHVVVSVIKKDVSKW